MDILEQIKEYHEENATNIMNIFELLMKENKLQDYTVIEVLEQTADNNRLGNEKIPHWFYDVVDYNDFCEYIESLNIIELGNDFIKVSDNEYYYIRDIVELAEGL
jgi:hypothetical protein|nr:MAG TPA: hypothetical protein [Caudoviricetes sp.]